jgi:hypothetical protein
MPSSGMLRRVALVRTGVSEEHIASVIRSTRIGVEIALAVTSNRMTLASVASYCKRCSQLCDPCHHHDGSDTFLKRRRFLQEPHGVTSQKTAFFIFTVVKTSNITG